jgi:hypothetical protein
MKLTGCSLAILSLAFALLTTGCPESKGKPIPTDLPQTTDVPNPDFLVGSLWSSESSISPLRQIQFLKQNYVVLTVENPKDVNAPTIPGLVTGSFSLRLSQPTAGQGIYTGYPLMVSSPRAIWFTDNPKNPGIAHLAVMLPLTPDGPNYFVLLGMYVRGLETMEWDLFIPVPSSESDEAKLDLRTSPDSTFKGQLVFRKIK